MRVASSVVVFGLLGCSTSPYDTAGSKEERAAPTKAEPVAAPAEEEAPQANKEVPPLSEEDLRLLEADPATLSPEERRQRAYAMRRKIMQDPDSPAARAIEDMAEAIRNGEVKPEVEGKKQYPKLYLPGKGPQGGGRPPAGARPNDAAEAKADEAEAKADEAP
jgi:hypothetical protein